MKNQKQKDWNLLKDLESKDNIIDKIKEDLKNLKFKFDNLLIENKKLKTENENLKNQKEELKAETSANKTENSNIDMLWTYFNICAKTIWKKNLRLPQGCARGPLMRWLGSSTSLQKTSFFIVRFWQIS